MNMTNEEIAHLFDNRPDMTLQKLARITGKTVAELRKILITDPIEETNQSFRSVKS